MGARTSVVEVTVTNPEGIHLRPATAFAKLALRHAANVVVSADGVEANGRSVLELSMMGVTCGTVLRISAEGEDAEAAAAALAGLVRADFR